jgi:hypothetical protein
MNEGDRAELYRLEQLLALAGERPTREELARYIADDFVEHGASGKIWTKGAVIERFKRGQVWSERLSIFVCERSATQSRW